MTVVMIRFELITMAVLPWGANLTGHEARLREMYLSQGLI
jgi:hypothetical protein